MEIYVMFIFPFQSLFVYMADKTQDVARAMVARGSFVEEPPSA